MINKWTKEKFEEYNDKHPDIYELFKQFALQIAKKKTSYSAKSIFHRVRWETDIGDVGGDYKIDDGWISHYARKFAKEFPQYEDFFKFRVRKNSYHLQEKVMLINSLYGMQSPKPSKDYAKKLQAAIDYLGEKYRLHSSIKKETK